ncbi:MAG: hypothetical protein IJD95_02505 [Clostridia bacterium]|nr:hypothetical protein [Clostridia bacterium]
MKKVVSFITAFALAFAILATATSCGPVESVSGTEAAKILLARERLDLSSASDVLNFLKLGGIASLKASAENLLATAESAELSLAVDDTDPLSVENKQWSKFPAYSAYLYDFEIFNGIVQSFVKTASKDIDDMKKKVAITDKWVGDRLLQVSESAETLFQRNVKRSFYKISKRTTESNAKSCYEIVQVEPNTTLYCKYIEDERFEFLTFDKSGFNDFVIASKSSGVWKITRFGLSESGSIVTVTVIADGIGYYMHLDLSKDMGLLPLSVSVFDVASKRDIAELWFADAVGGDRYKISVNFSSVKSGFKSLVAYGDSLEGVYSVNGGYEGYSLPFAINANGGMIKAGMTDGTVTYESSTLRYQPNGKKYYGYFDFIVPHAAVNSMFDAYSKVISYLSGFGISFHFSPSDVSQGVNLATRLGNGTFENWNGYDFTKISNIEAAFEITKNKCDSFYSQYEAVKDNETASARYVVQNGLFFANIAVNGGSCSYASKTVTVEGLSASVDANGLFENGKEYILKLGLALVEENAYCSENVVPLISSVKETPVSYNGSSFTLSHSGSYSLPEMLAEGFYAVVAYVATADEGIRVTEMYPVAFYSATEEKFSTETMEIEIKKLENNLLGADYKMKTELIAKIENAKESYTVSDLTAILLTEADKYGIQIADAKLETASGAAVEADAVITSGSYRIKFNLYGVSGYKAAYMYIELPTKE